MQIDDLPRPGRPIELHVVSRYLAGSLGCSHTEMEKRLNELGKTWRYRVSIPDELSPHQLQYRVDVSMDLMTSHRNYQWLHNLITDDEKWVLDINYKHRHPWISTGETVTETRRSGRHLNESDAERLVRSQWYYSLGNSLKWFHYDCRTLLSANGSGY